MRPSSALHRRSFLSFFSCVAKIFGNLTLGGKFGFEAVAAITGVDKETFAGLVGVFAEKVAQEVIHDIRSGLKIHIEPEVVVVAQLVGVEGKGGIKHAQQTVELSHWNLPDAEEAEHVVDAVNVEIFGHLAETGLPPCEAVAVHLLPVVGGEAPVLSHHREVIRGSACLAVEIEQTRREPCINAGAGNADGDVALDWPRHGRGRSRAPRASVCRDDTESSKRS